MKSTLRCVNNHGLVYNALMFVCPGCVEMDGSSGLHMLPVNSDVKKPSWTWDGDLIRPSLTPSILTGEGKMVCPIHCSKCGHNRKFEDYLDFCRVCHVGDPCNGSMRR